MILTDLYKTCAVAIASERTRAQFIRFLFTGVLNTLFGYCVFALLLFMGVGAFGALLFATIAGVIFNFQTIGRLVFRRLEARMIFRFVMVYIVVFLLNWAGLNALMTLGVSGYLAQAILLVPVAVLSFFGHKLFVFEGRSKGSNR